MATGSMLDVAIKGIACAVPTNRIETSAFADRFGESAVSRFVATTGIRSRYVCGPEQCVSDLCYTAAVRLLESLGWDASSIDALIYVCATPDYKMPATSCVLQHRLGLGEGCVLLDINYGCSGYVYGLWLAGTLAHAGLRRVLLLVGNQLSINIRPDDSSTAMLFGDAGSATAIEAQVGSRMEYMLKAKGEGFSSIIVPTGAARNRIYTVRGRESGYIMKGPEVFAFTVQDVADSLKRFVERFAINDADVDAYLLHQANLLILKQISKKLRFPQEKVLRSIDHYANTSGASIPLTLITNLDKIRSGMLRVLMCGFGVGLSWGAISATIDSTSCLPLIHNDDFFKDGWPDNL